MKFLLLLLDLFDPLCPNSLFPEFVVPVRFFPYSSTQGTHPELDQRPRKIHVGGVFGESESVPVANVRERMQQSGPSDVQEGDRVLFC